MSPTWMLVVAAPAEPSSWTTDMVTV